jgi:hypothetical protein
MINYYKYCINKEIFIDSQVDSYLICLKIILRNHSKMMINTGIGKYHHTYSLYSMNYFNKHLVILKLVNHSINN